MSANRVELQGVITVGDGAGCGPCTAPGSMKSQGIALACSSKYYEAIVSSDAPIAVATPGAVGAAWIDLPVTSALEQIELLLVRSNAPMRLRLGAEPAQLIGEGATYPTGFVGGETLVLELDGVPLSLAFTSGAQTAQQVANQINAAAALAGFAYMPASVQGGQLALEGRATGVQGNVDVASGSAVTALGFTALETAQGEGEDLDFNGLYLVEYGRGASYAPSRVQISGTGSIEVFAAGTPA